MGFLDRLFGGRAKTAKETRFPGEKMVVKAPMDGIVLPLEQLPDETFAAAILGPGCGIEPTGGTVYAPFDGKITSIVPTLHAVGLENLSAYQQEIVQECCCQLAEFAHDNADVLESIVSGYSINGASLTLSGSSTAVETVSGICLPRAVYRNLCQTGLCCRSETRWRDAIP